VRASISGVVRIKIEISEDGEVLRIKVKPRTNPLLKTAVVDAVKRWTFKPWPGTDVAGKAVISRLTFRFTIQNGEPHVAMYEPPGTSQTECLDVMTPRSSCENGGNGKKFRLIDRKA